MKIKFALSILSLTAAAAFAAPPATAPAGTTGMCNDGTFSSAARKQGACRGHQGVKEWYAAAPATAASKAVAATPAKPATPAVPAKPVAPATPAKPAAPAKPAPVAAPGQVWVNESSKVFHCAGTKWYGQTKNGVYMSEAEALAKGYKAAHNRSCAN
ncbi:MAG: DUF3761 domain-containing protein [Brachymonas sp.]|nr:DUF3761 domain-containing protein [Brachymonas sp.]